MTALQHADGLETAGGRHPQPAAVEIDSGRWRASIDDVLEIWRYRPVLLAFAIRQFKVKYKQAVIGIGWSLIQPLAASVLFAIFFGRFAHLPSEGIPYVTFALAGMVAWVFFANAVSTASESLVRDGGMIQKVYFPREALPLASVGAALAELPAALAVLLLAALAAGARPSLTWLLLPLPIILLAMLATAAGLALGGLNVYYRDVHHALPFVLQLVLFASPIAYSIDLVPGAWRNLYEVLNPVATAINDIRILVLHDRLPGPWVNLGALGWTLVLLVCGYFLFKRLERGFADQL